MLLLFADNDFEPLKSESDDEETIEREEEQSVNVRIELPIGTCYILE